MSAFRKLVILALVLTLQKFLFARGMIRYQDLGLMALAPSRGIIAYIMSLWIVNHKGRCGRSVSQTWQFFTGDEETHKIVVYATVYFSLLHVPLARSLR